MQDVSELAQLPVTAVHSSSLSRLHEASKSATVLGVVHMQRGRIIDLSLILTTIQMHTLTTIDNDTPDLMTTCER